MVEPGIELGTSWSRVRFPNHEAGHEARLRCPDEKDGEMRDESEVPGGGLKPNFYQLPRPWSQWASSPFKEKRTW